MWDGDAFGQALVAEVKAAIERSTAPLLKRIADLEVEVVGLRSLDHSVAIAHAVRAAVEAMPKPVDGKDGRDGADGQPGEKGEPGEPGRDGLDAAPVSDEAIARAVAHWLEANPPLAGKDGVDGAPGEKGEPGRDGQDAAPVSDEAVAEVVAKWLEANPPAKGDPGRDGLDGKDGRDGVDGRDGAPGEKGQDGKDGVGLAGALIDRDGQLVVTLTDGTTRELGPVVGKDGAPGEKGRDGFDLRDFDTEIRDGGRTLLFKFEQDGHSETHELALNVMLYRGVYKEDRAGGYEPGDTVTFGGSLWHCNEPTAAKPGENEKAWSLAAKRGRDGNNGKDGRAPEPPQPVKLST
jgi:hypothetical protein